MENKEKAGLLTVLFHHGFLTILENRRFQFHLSGLVHTVDIAEGRGKEIPATLDRIEAPGHLEGVLGRGVELSPCCTRHPILLSADHTRFDLEDELILLEPIEKLDRNTEVLLERQGTCVENVAAAQGELLR